MPWPMSSRPWVLASVWLQTIRKFVAVLLVLVDDLERVGRLGVVVQGEPAAGGGDRSCGASTSIAQWTGSTMWQQKSVRRPPP